LETGHVTGDEACRVFDALREAQAFLQDMTAVCHGPRSQIARELLKKWLEHD